MPLNSFQLNSLVKNIKKDVLENYKDEVKQIILFGSYAKNKPTNKSDIDILVLFKYNTSTIPDLLFADKLYNKYMKEINKEVHICFEKYELYIRGAEDFYKAVPTYGIVVYKS